VVISDIQDAWWIGASAGKKTANAMAYLTLAPSPTNTLGTLPPSSFTLTLGTASVPITPLGLTTESLFVDLLVSYPTSVGLTMTPKNTYGSNSFAVTGGSLPATSPVSFSAFAVQAFDETHREVQLEYTTVALTVTQAADTIVNSNTVFRLPERAATVTSVLRNSSPIVGTVALNPTGRMAHFSNPSDYTNPGDVLTITYTAIRPMPQNSTGSQLQMTIYYDAAAPQAARQQLLGTGLTVIPKCVSDSLYVLTTGSGSQDEGYPWPQGYVQTGGIDVWGGTTGGQYSGEGHLSGRAEVAVTDFNANTGFLRLSNFIPMVANPDQLVFTGVGTDIEGRSYFNAVPTGAYLLNAYAQDLSNACRHKNVLPMLCELAVDSTFGFKGQLVLVLLTRYAWIDQHNCVNMETPLLVSTSTTTASVFRLNLLDKRAS
jgi:hypothetical protein